MEITVNKDTFESLIAEFAATGKMGDRDITGMWLNTKTNLDLWPFAARIAIDLSSL